MTRGCTLLPAVAVLLLVAADAPAAKYPEPPDATALLYFAPKAQTALKLDGVLDDACWQAAPTITDFGRIHLGVGPAAKQTFVKAVYDDEAVYFAFRCPEPHMQRLQVVTGRDSNIWTGDCVEIYLRPDLGRPVRYQFAVNVAGERWDAWITGPPRQAEYDAFWGRDAQWRGVGAKEAEAWTIEVRVPFSDVAIQPGRPFGFNLVRLTWTEGKTEGKEFSAWAHATYEQKDFRYWATFVFDQPGLDKVQAAKGLVSDHDRRAVSWPTQDGVAVLDRGQYSEKRFAAAAPDELGALDAALARAETDLKALGAQCALKALPARLKELRGRRDALARRIEAERFTEVGLAQLREQIGLEMRSVEDLAWDVRGIQTVLATP